MPQFINGTIQSFSVEIEHKLDKLLTKLLRRETLKRLV